MLAFDTGFVYTGRGKLTRGGMGMGLVSSSPSTVILLLDEATSVQQKTGEGRKCDRGSESLLIEHRRWSFCPQFLHRDVGDALVNSGWPGLL